MGAVLAVHCVDPRFDGLSGKFNYDLYRKSYKWMEQKQDDEVKELRERMFSTDNDEEKKNIQVIHDH